MGKRMLLSSLAFSSLFLFIVRMSEKALAESVEQRSTLSLTEKVKFSLDNNNDADAQTAVDRLLKDYPPDEYKANAVKEIADIYRAKSRHEQANQLCEYFVDNWPDHKDAIGLQKDLICNNVSHDDEAAAQANMDKLITVFYNHDDLYNTIRDIAEQFRRTNQHERAQEYFKYVIENDPSSDAAFWAKVNLARSYITTNQGPKAQDLIDELFAVSDGDKTKAEGAHILAEDYLYIWKKREANQLFRYFVENDPNNPDAREALAQVAYTFLAIEDCNGAEAAAKQFIAKYSDHNDTPKFVHTLASGFRQKGQFEKALLLLDYVISNYPDDPHYEKAWMEVATIGFDSGKDVIVELVINKFKKELPENPFIAEPFRIFVDQFALRYEAQQAHELYQYIIDHSKDNEEVLQSLMGQAMILIDANDETAFDALFADLSSHPEAGKLFYALAVKCERFEHFEYAEAAYRRIIEVDPNCDAGAVFQYIGWTLFVRGLYSQAITEYRQTAEEYPNSKWAPSCQYWIGQSYHKKRDYEQARMEYQKVVDKYPDNRYANYSRQKIALIDRMRK